MSSPNSSPTLSPSFVRALSPTPTVLEPSFFVLPDLVSHCSFSLTYHDDGDAIAADSLDWILSFSPHFSQDKVAAMRGLQAGELTAYCYNNCTSPRLRVVSDFMNYLFHLDDVSDGFLARDAEGLANWVMNAFEWPDDYRPVRGQRGGIQENNAAKLAREGSSRGARVSPSFWSRCIRDCAPAVQQRFKSHMQMFFQAVQQQALCRADGIVSDLETYIDMRRDTSGCKPVFDLIEYSLDLELPDAVIEHPVIAALNQGANDLVTWSNDLFSYNVEQSRGDTHNMVCVFMIHDGLGLQQAVDRIGEMCKQTIDAFVRNRERVPSWGDRVDEDVKLYVNGLQEWIVGSLHWSFMTTRYFGDNGGLVKATRIVDLVSRECSKAA
ncbi:isoprenoid synthase domain-containing protein [Russula earlei]|uniref:Isoprenoid synthase domain-containing protein n=1 Tax=Russula earlei TaxID=71964 RepID=A0ACC0U475_9AGAM|nr:isoprenoid synthase domain-containing protein [Russula earlei]